VGLLGRVASVEMWREDWEVLKRALGLDSVLRLKALDQPWLGGVW
jgi:hypothetical protein